MRLKRRPHDTAALIIAKTTEAARRAAMATDATVATADGTVAAAGCIEVVIDF